MNKDIKNKLQQVENIKTLIWTHKGGVGKSAITYNLYSYFKQNGYQLGVYTNDERTYLTDLIEEDYFIASSEEMEGLDDLSDVIFDLGGKTDDLLVNKCVRNSDTIIVPIKEPNCNATFGALDDIITIVEEYELIDKHIIILINDNVELSDTNKLKNTDEDFIKVITDQLLERYEEVMKFLNIEIRYLYTTKGLKNIAQKQEDIFTYSKSHKFKEMATQKQRVQLIDICNCIIDDNIKNQNK